MKKLQPTTQYKKDLKRFKNYPAKLGSAIGGLFHLVAGL